MSNPYPLAPDEIQKIVEETGQPLAYVEGFAYFYGRKFVITPDVLIPRPETEDLIAIANELKPKSLVDVGTGSGIIAITLALELPGTEIVAVEISEKALKIARKNAEILGVKNINFLKSNLLNEVPSDKKFELIVANLPYVNKDWPWLDKKALGFEPEIALYAEDGGLALIKRLVMKAPKHLEEAGYLLLEADLSQHEEIVTFAEDHHFCLVKAKGLAILLKLC